MTFSTSTPRFLNNKTVCLIGPCKKDIELDHFSEDQLIFVDGGAQHAKKMKSPIIVGDNDSFQNKDIPFYKEFNPEKDFSDLKGALNLLTKDQKHIYLCGFSGGRLDHYLSVIGECFDHLKKNFHSKIYLGKNIEFYPSGDHQIELDGRFSLMSFYPIKITIKGDVKYKCHELEVFPGSSSLLSNASHGVFRLECDQPVALIKGTLCED